MSSSDRICAVFVCNRAYFDKFLFTAHQLLTNGKYTGPIYLIAGNDFNLSSLMQHDFIRHQGVIVQQFPDLPIPDDFWITTERLKRNPVWNQKRFQYHKLYLMDPFFQKWNYIFYLDCGAHIYSDIQPILDLRLPNTLLAHHDAFPTYEWKLSQQYDSTTYPDIYQKLSQDYNLNVDYFQTTIMLFDTAII